MRIMLRAITFCIFSSEARSPSTWQIVAPSLIRNAQRLYEELHGVGEGVFVEHLEVLRDKPTTLARKPLASPWGWQLEPRVQRAGGMRRQSRVFALTY